MKNALGVILLLAGGLGVSEPVEAARFSGRPLKMTAVTKSDGPFTLNVVNQWKTVPGMFVDFTTTKPGAAVATFCAEVTTGSPLLIRIRESGVGDWEPGGTQFVADTASIQTHCFSWFATLPAGTYRIKAQFMNLLGGNLPTMSNRSLRVQHEN